VLARDSLELNEEHYDEEVRSDTVRSAHLASAHTMRWRGCSGVAYSDTNSYSDSKPDSDSDTDTHPDPDSDTHPLNLHPAPTWSLVNPASNDAN
jgi:hypothetical protein